MPGASALCRKGFSQNHETLMLPQVVRLLILFSVGIIMWNKVAFLFIYKWAPRKGRRFRGLLTSDAWKNKASPPAEAPYQAEIEAADVLFCVFLVISSTLFSVFACVTEKVWWSLLSSQPHHGNARPLRLTPLKVFRLLKALQNTDFYARKNKTLLVKIKLLQSSVIIFCLWFGFRNVDF